MNMHIEVELICDCGNRDSVSQDSCTTPECSAGCGRKMRPTGKEHLPHLSIWLTRENGTVAVNDVRFDGKSTGALTIGEAIEILVGICSSASTTFEPGLSYLQDENYWNRFYKREEKPLTDSEVDAEFEVQQ